MKTYITKKTLRCLRIQLAWMSYFCLICGFAWPTSSSAKSTVAELLHSTPFDQEDIQQVLKGKLVSTGVKPVGEHEVVAGLACLAQEKGVDTFKLIQQGAWITPNAELIGSELINDEDSLDSFKSLSFDPHYLDEVTRYPKAKAGSGFNFSTHEIKTLQSLSLTGQSTRDAGVVSSALRQILLSRYQAYRKGGLQGIIPYDRGRGRKAQPGKLLHQTIDLSFYLRREFPEVHEALMHYPDTVNLSINHDFHWISIEIEGRPVFALSHRLVHETERAGIVVKRIFYLSRALDAAQVVVALMPAAEGSLLVFVSRIWTERVTGFAKGAKRKVARDILVREMTRIAEEMKACK
jgi:hypothetical protein